VKSVFHAKEFGKIINFKTPEDARVNMILLLKPDRSLSLQADKFCWEFLHLLR
jgi:hypothetical protein